MTNLTRKNQKVFASGASNNGQFGSLQAETKVLSNDVETLQALAAYESGWNSAVVSGEQLPSLEEFQALNYINTYQIGYLLQKGFPEWNTDTTYYIGDLAREVGGTKIYKSITNSNSGNALTDVANWILATDLQNNTVGQVSAFAMTTPPLGWLECNGSAISRTTYAALFAALSTTWGIGDGSTTFNIPDLRGEFIRGWDNGVGRDSGRAFASFQLDEFEAHTHGIQHSGESGTTGSYIAGASFTNQTRQTTSSGGVETRPRNYALMYCIKY